MNLVTGWEGGEMHLKVFFCVFSKFIELEPCWTNFTTGEEGMLKSNIEVREGEIFVAYFDNGHYFL